MIGHLILRLTIWFLLTSDLSLANIVIGVAIALLLPRGYTSPKVLKDWLRAMWQVMVAVPTAYLEAFEIILRPHEREDIELERVQPKRSPGLIFLDIYLITFTPKTIVTRHRKDGWYEVHRLRPGRKA